MSGDPFFLCSKWIFDLLSSINPKDQVGMIIFLNGRKGSIPLRILGRHRKTRDDLAPLIPGVLYIHLGDEVGRSHSHVKDGEPGLTGELRLLWVGLQ